MNSLHPLYNYTGSTGLYYDDSLLSSNVYNQVITNYISSNVISDVIKPYISSNVLTNILYNTSNSLINVIEDGINQITELLGDSVIPASTITGAIVANDIITTANTASIGVNTLAIAGLTTITTANSASIVSLSASKTNTSDFNHGNIGYKAFTDTNGINTSLWALYDTNIFQDLLVPFSQNYYCSLKEPYLSLPTNYTNLNNDYNTFKNTTIPATYINSNVIRILLNDSDNKNINTYLSSNVLNNVLASYPSSNVLNNVLASYPSSNVLNNVISYYPSSNVLNNVISYYPSSNVLTNVISPYISSNALLGYKYLTANVFSIYSEERLFPPKLYNSASDQITVTFLNKPVIYQSVTLTNTGITYGAGDYEIYSSTLNNSTNDKKYIFNTNLGDSNPSPQWAPNTYDINNGIYKTASGSFIINDYLGEWLIIKLPEIISLTKFIFHIRSGINNRAPGLWRCYGSNDGINFTRIPDASNESVIATYTNNSHTKTISSITPFYRYIGFTINRLAGNTNVLNLSELMLYGYSFVFTPFNLINSNVLGDVISNYPSSNILGNVISNYPSSNVLGNVISNYPSSNVLGNVLSTYVKITDFNTLATSIPYINTLNISGYPSSEPSFGTNYFNVGSRNIYYSEYQLGLSIGGVSYGGGGFYIIKGTELVTANIGLINSVSKIELKYGDTIITSPNTIIQSPNITLNGKISGDNLITRGAKFFTCTIKKWLPLGYNGSSAYVDIYILDLTTLTNIFNNSRLFNITLFPEQSFGYSTEADRFIINHKIFMNATNGFINANSFIGTNQLFIRNDMTDNGALINGLVYIDLNKIMFKCGDTSKGLKWYYIIEDLFA